MQHLLVCFDLWNTLIFEAAPGELVRARQSGVIRELAEQGIRIDGQQFSAAHVVAQEQFEDAWEQGTQFRAEDAAAVITSQLGLDAQLAGAVHAGFIRGVRDARIELVPGAKAAVEAVRALGARTAIVCDVGLTPSDVLIEWLEEFGFGGMFDCMAFSDQLGVYKPATEIFAWVCDAVKHDDPAAAVHVGDRRRTDICGAFNFGMRSVRFRGVYDDTTLEREADHVVDDMEELLELLSAGPSADG